MARLTTAEDIKARLIEGYDVEDANSVYRQLRYAFGDDWQVDGTQAGIGHGRFPDFPDVTVSLRKIGKSHRILNVAKIALSRLGYSDPAPEFPDVDRYTAQVRKQFYRKRYKEGEWQDEMAAAIFDATQFGQGFVKIGLKTNPSTGKQRVHLQHSPRLHTIWDRHARQLSQMRWVCFANYIAPEVAAELYGEQVAKDYTRQLYPQATMGDASPMSVVRIFEYYDLAGAGKNTVNTCAIIPGDLTEEPISVEESDYDILPVSWMTNVKLPGMKRAVGNVFFAQPVNEALDRMEESLMTDVEKNSALTLIDPHQVNPQDLQEAISGKGSGFVRWDNPSTDGKPPILRVSPVEIDANRLQAIGRLDRAMNEATGTTELDRGNQLQQTKTLGEAELLTNRSSSMGSWSVKQTILFHERTVKAVLEVARMGDVDPATLDMSDIGFSTPYTVNKPGNKASRVSNWLKEPSEVLIGDDALTVTDNKAHQAQEISKWMGMVTALQAGLPIDRKWLAEKLILATGEKDASDALDKSYMEQGGAPMGAMPPGQVPGQMAPPTQDMRGGISPVQAPPAVSPFARPGQ